MGIGIVFGGAPYFARWAQYGLLSPYFARWAQYGLFGSGYVLTALRAYASAVALFRSRSIRALWRLLARCQYAAFLGLRASRSPQAVFLRPFRAHHLQFLG